MFDFSLWQEFKKTIQPLPKCENNIPAPPKKRFLKKAGPALLPLQIDFHGATLESAYTLFLNTLQQAKQEKKDKIVFITGKGHEGQIKKEFPFWVENNQKKYHILNMQEISQGGAYIIYFKKDKK